MNQRGKGSQGSQGTETGREESELKEDKEQKEPTGKTSGTSSVVEGEQRGGLGLGAGNQVEVKQHAGSAANSVTGRRGQEEEYQPEQSPATELEEMTFNMKKRNRSLEDEFSYQPNMQTEEPQEDKDEVSLDEVEETNKSINRIAKLANKYFPQNYKPN